MGTLAVEVKSGSCSWIRVWERSGQQHSSGAAAWTSEQVSFPTTVQQVRFVGVTGSGYHSDAAVANVALIAGCAPAPAPPPATPPPAPPPALFCFEPTQFGP